MLTTRHTVTLCSVAFVAFLTGCPKKIDLSLPEAGLTVIDAGSATAETTDAGAVDAAAPLTTTATTTVTAPHGCGPGQAAFLVDGVTKCEQECNAAKGKAGECAIPMVCIGVAPLVGAEAGAAQVNYCRTAPSGACPQANMAQFWNNNAGGRPTCEVLCNAATDTTCPAGTTCKGNAMLFLVNGKQGETHRFCRK